MKYDPRDATKSIPKGWYPAIIDSVVDGTSKSSGAEMQTVTFRVYGLSQEITVKEFFTGGTLWKYKALAVALGQGVEFQNASFNAADFVNQALDIEIKIEDSAQYGEQNRVKGFDADGSQAGGRPVSKPKPAGTPWSASPNTDTKPDTIDADDIPF